MKTNVQSAFFCTFSLFVVSPTVAPLAVQPSALENISPVSPQAVVEVHLHSPCIDWIPTPAFLHQIQAV